MTDMTLIGIIIGVLLVLAMAVSSDHEGATQKLHIRFGSPVDVFYRAERHDSNKAERLAQPSQRRTTLSAMERARPHMRVSSVPHTRPTALLPQSRLSTQASDEGVSMQKMIETWRNSILGLIKLAQRNLTHARQCQERQDYKAAVEAALTSTENISRALLHCFGEKPELSSGQEEALQLLARRFRELERVEFERVIEAVARLSYNRTVQRYISTRNVDFSFLLTEARTVLIIDSASKVVARFTRIICERFQTEIPELAETCPKCHALEVALMAFNQTTVNHTCWLCRHSWVEPRMLSSSKRDEENEKRR